MGKVSETVHLYIVRVVAREHISATANPLDRSFVGFLTACERSRLWIHLSCSRGRGLRFMLFNLRVTILRSSFLNVVCAKVNIIFFDYTVKNEKKNANICSGSRHLSRVYCAVSSLKSYAEVVGIR